MTSDVFTCLQHQWQSIFPDATTILVRTLKGRFSAVVSGCSPILNLVEMCRHPTIALDPSSKFCSDP